MPKNMEIGLTFTILSMVGHVATTKSPRQFDAFGFKGKDPKSGTLPIPKIMKIWLTMEVMQRAF
jgi:hypothetical protein